MRGVLSELGVCFSAFAWRVTVRIYSIDEPAWCRGSAACQLILRTVESAFKPGRGVSGSLIGMTARPADYDEWLHSKNVDAVRAMQQLCPAQDMETEPANV